MPMTVITLQKSTPSLRGDLTKWMQEIDKGVYIGSFNSKIREELWNRVKKNIGNGRATLSYHSRNELGYIFETHKTERRIVDYDGIQLVSFPDSNDGLDSCKGFSNASKLRKAKLFATKKSGMSVAARLDKYILLDIETDGLDKDIDNIIEIGAVKVEYNNITYMDILISTGKIVPSRITELTGITTDLLRTKGVDVDKALEKITAFIGDYPVIGYNVNFDIGFIDSELKKCGRKKLLNRTYDLMRFVKKERMFLSNYKLQTVLNEYGINGKVVHRALEDAKIIYELANKVNGFLAFVKSQY